MAIDIDASAEAGVSVPAPPRENIVRALMPGISFRAADPSAADAPNDGRLGTLTGHFAVFNEWTEINSIWEGNFLERIAPGAFKKTFRERTPKVLFQHGGDPVVGDKPLGSIDALREDDVGGYYEAALIDTSYNRDLLPGLERGLYGASFRFRVIREDIDEEPGTSDTNPRGLPERTIREAQVMEFGPVTFPAYAGATAGVRSMTDDYIFQRFLTQPDRLRELLTHFAKLPNAAAEEAAEEEPAPTEDRAEPEAHPVDVRRDTRPLFGTDKETESWRL